MDEKKGDKAQARDFRKATPENADFFPAKDKAALFANRYHIAMTPTMTRIVFGEAVVPGTDNWHSAVILPTQEAKEFVKLIQDLIDSGADRE